MLTSVTIENFRNLDYLTLERLGRLTLIGGQNGSGKTALLEALFLHSGPDKPQLSESVNSFRGMPAPGREHAFQGIFSELNTDKAIRISALGDWGDMPRTLDIRVQERRGVAIIPADSVDRPRVGRFTTSQAEGNFEIVFSYCHDDGTNYTARAWWHTETLSLGPPAQAIVQEGILQEGERVPNKSLSVFMPPVHRDELQVTASRFGKLQLDGEERRALDFIRPMEARLQGLTPIMVNDVPVIHATLKGVSRPIPMQLLGEGLNRMFGIVLAMNEARGGMLLIDEIENGLHHNVHEQVFSDLLNLAKACDVQVFATTHSGECLRAAYRAHEKQEALDNFAYYRLDRVGGKTEAFQFDGEMMETAIELNWNVR